MSKETVEARTLANEEEEKVMKQMSDFDFSVPVQVEVIFEDSDEDINIKQESSEQTVDNNALDIVEEHVAVGPSKTLNDSIEGGVHNKDVEKSISKNETATLIDNKDTNSHTMPEINVEELISQAIKRVRVMKNSTSTDNNNLKRKKDLEAPCRKKRKGLTMSDHFINNNNTDSCTQQNIPCSDTTSATHEQISRTNENTVNIPKSNITNKGNIPETFKTGALANPCISNLLKTVARSLIFVIRAHNIWRHTENKATSQREIDESRSQFMRIRNHFFHIGYSAVESIIIPQLENVNFIKDFLNEAVKLGYEMKQCVNLETQLEPVFYELVEWTKRKKWTFSGDSVLNFLLQSPPKPMNFQSTDPNINKNLLKPSVENSETQSRVAERSRIPTENVTADLTKTLSLNNNTASGKSVLFSSSGCQIEVDQCYLQSHGKINDNNTYTYFEGLNSTGINHIYPPQMHPSGNDCYSQSQHSKGQTNEVNLLQTQSNSINHLTETFEMPPVSRPPPPYQHTRIANSWQNQTPVTSTMNCMEMQINAGHLQQPPSARVHHQNAEITRSLSTDSGFVSPLNFNNPDMTNYENEKDETSSATPRISHITSLNPKANYIKQGSCHVCGKITQMMCIACFRKYYCSLHCQRADWVFHSRICKRI